MTDAPTPRPTQPDVALPDAALRDADVLAMADDPAVTAALPTTPAAALTVDAPATPVAAPKMDVPATPVAAPKVDVPKVDVAVPKAAPRTPEQIEADMRAARERLTSGVTDIKDYVAPKSVAQRQTNKVRAFFVDEFGGVRPERVAMVAGGVVGLLIVRKGLRSWNVHRTMKRLGDVAWVPMPVAAVPPLLAPVAKSKSPVG